MNNETNFKEIELRQSVGASGVNIRLNLMQSYRLTYCLRELKDSDKIDTSVLHQCGIIALLDMIQQSLQLEGNSDRFSIEAVGNMER